MNVNAINITSPIKTQFDNVLQNNDNKKTENNQVSFSEIIGNVLNNVNQSQVIADEKIQGLITGDESISMHDVMLSMQESQISMEALIQIRNQIVECYKELNNTTL